MQIGSRLRQLRKERGMTLVELAKQSHIDQATISRIETGKMIGTLESHHAMARVLHMTLSEFYAGLDEEQPARIAVQAAVTPTESYIHQSGAADYTLLTRDVLAKKMMPVLMTVAPRSSTPEEQLPFGSERFVYVLAGTVQARIGEEHVTMATGHTVYFQAHLPHTFTNNQRQAARCVLVSTPPAL